MLKVLDVHLEINRYEPNGDTPSDLDACCFASSSAVESWVGGIESADTMAICINTETARRALETGKWESRHIYYPKGDEDGQNIASWADMSLQAVGDIMERKFWGGGW